MPDAFVFFEWIAKRKKRGLSRSSTTKYHEPYYHDVANNEREEAVFRSNASGDWAIALVHITYILALKRFTHSITLPYDGMNTSVIHNMYQAKPDNEFTIQIVVAWILIYNVVSLFHPYYWVTACCRPYPTLVPLSLFFSVMSVQ